MARISVFGLQFVVDRETGRSPVIVRPRKFASRPCRATPPTPLRIARDIDTRVKTSTIPSDVESRSGISDGGSRFGAVLSPGKSKPSAQHPLRSEPRRRVVGEEREWERAAVGERWRPRASPSGSSIGTLARCSASARRERRCKTVSTSARTSTATPATRRPHHHDVAFPRQPAITDARRLTRRPVPIPDRQRSGHNQRGGVR